ncbi:MAG: F0F1 ATP synthase subunit B' [Paracoccaceae bacterium]|nr:F0F1 ATP synthase subunit B' [Paracoccaceae bacterium]MDE3122791.1 F0F1 ATP synthase subunit B' [Paracoccaceae bacterium]MDE3240109.1 F0F1 ATP synthase subunit B' [Paracoccaceae bacterium]
MATEAATKTVAMPQLDFSTYVNQFFWLLVTLVVIYFVVTRLVIPRIGGVLADRKSTIERDIAAAEELKQKAISAEAAYNQALADARSEAARIVEAARAEIKKDLDEATSRADAEIMAKSAESEKRIAAIRDSALESVTQVAHETAAEIVAVMGGSADAEAVSAAVAARLKG